MWRVREKQLTCSIIRVMIPAALRAW
jgi:hypothetical protein